jgi:hypothetical protein
MAPLIVAPQAAGLPRASYLNVDEYLNSPVAIDTSDLVPDGSDEVQRDALATMIARASSWMDGYVHYTLGATLDTETCRSRIRVDGTVIVSTRGIPVLEVDSFLIGATPSALAAVTVAAAADAWIEDNTITMPAFLSAGRDGVAWGLGLGVRVYCQWTYVNGFVNTLSAAATSVGDLSLSVQNPLGIYPGTELTIYDSGQTENVTVGPGYAAGSASLPLSTALLFSHAAGISVSALPPAVKEAAVLATSSMIKTRGADSLRMDSATGSAGAGGGEPGADDLIDAENLLTRFVLPLW